MQPRLTMRPLMTAINKYKIDFFIGFSFGFSFLYLKRRGGGVSKGWVILSPINGGGKNSVMSQILKLMYSFLYTALQNLLPAHYFIPPIAKIGNLKYVSYFFVLNEAKKVSYLCTHFCTLRFKICFQHTILSHPLQK